MSDPSMLCIGHAWSISYQAVVDFSSTDSAASQDTTADRPCDSRTEP